MSEVIESTREVIEHKLLMAVNDSTKVAIVLTAPELDDLIQATQHGRRYLTPSQIALVEDMRKLQDAAFPEWRGET